jgi:CubicO group peptidase (beta-lactamase class C family)
MLTQNEGELFKAAYGYANRAWNVENRVDTRFRIASVSKMFTAVAVLQLIEEGKLSLDTCIAEHHGLENTSLPKEATVHHMLAMTSGIADWFEESGDWEENWAARDTSCWASRSRRSPVVPTLTMYATTSSRRQG